MKEARRTSAPCPQAELLVPIDPGASYLGFPTKAEVRCALGFLRAVANKGSTEPNEETTETKHELLGVLIDRGALYLGIRGALDTEARRTSASQGQVGSVSVVGLFLSVVSLLVSVIYLFVSAFFFVCLLLLSL